MRSDSRPSFVFFVAALVLLVVSASAETLVCGASDIEGASASIVCPSDWV
jgi:hypothetical protein